MSNVPTITPGPDDSDHMPEGATETFPLITSVQADAQNDRPNNTVEISDEEAYAKLKAKRAERRRKKLIRRGIVGGVVGANEAGPAEFEGQIRIRGFEIVAARGSGEGDAAEGGGHKGGRCRAARPGRIDEVHAVFAEAIGQMASREKSPEIFAKNFPRGPAPAEAAPEKPEETARGPDTLARGIPQQQWQGARAEPFCPWRRRQHGRGAAAQMPAVETVDSDRQMGAQPFHLLKNEGLGKERVPQQDAGHMGAVLWQGGQCHVQSPAKGGAGWGGQWAAMSRMGR